MNYYVALAGMAAWFLFGYWAGQRYERRRVLVVVGDKRQGMPDDDRCCRSALRDVERDIIRGKMPTDERRRW